MKVSGEASHVIVAVWNGGPAIPPGELAKILDPLVRGSSAEHPTANRPDSIGLGLYIARAIAESHGGSIKVTTSRETGTTFVVRLPREFSVKVPQSVLDEQHLGTM